MSHLSEGQRLALKVRPDARLSTLLNALSLAESGSQLEVDILRATFDSTENEALERVVHMLQSMQIDSVPNLVDRGRVIDCVRALKGR